MKNYDQVGGRQGRPAYRTPSHWLGRRGVRPKSKPRFNEGKGKKFRT